jgi:hypothetical protein
LAGAKAPVSESNVSDDASVPGQIDRTRALIVRENEFRYRREILTIAEHDTDIAERNGATIGFEHNLPEAPFVGSDIDLVSVAAEFHNTGAEALPALCGL